MTLRRALLLVLDGLGIGAMPDAGERDGQSHTLRHVFEASPALRLPNLVRLGLAEAAGMPQLAGQAAEVVGAHGKAALGYPGADTYLGHQELMGSSLRDVRLHMLSAARDAIRDELQREGHQVRDARRDTSALYVDERVVVADNIEAAPGLNINVTGSLDEASFEELVRIGHAVRRRVRVPRVIVVGGRGFRGSDIIGSLRERGPGHVGVDTPALGVYDADYQVRHLGGGGRDARSLAALVRQSGQEVVLLGKAADVIECEGAVQQNHIRTGDVLSATLEHLSPSLRGLVVANVQETDLAGHEQDPQRFAGALEEVDEAIPALLAALGSAGVLLVTADHGNDPCIGHSQHTREFTPLLAGGAGVRGVALGTRESLSDAAATLAELLGVGAVPQGVSLATRILGAP